MDILNFISWIKGGRVVTSVDPTQTLIPVGLKDNRRDDGYLAGAITVQDLAAQIGSGAIPVVTSYPTTTPSEAGNTFWYKGNLWHYMTQDEIDSADWTGLVNVGFPAPVSKNYNPFILYNGNVKFNMASTNVSQVVGGASANFIYDTLGQGRPDKIENGIYITSFPGSTVEFKNVQLLTSLKNPSGTTPAVVVLFTANLTAALINQFFTDLPPTTEVCTLNFEFNPGSATCDPTIATSKGYIVVV